MKIELGTFRYALLDLYYKDKTLNLFMEHQKEKIVHYKWGLYEQVLAEEHGKSFPSWSFGILGNPFWSIAILTTVVKS